MVGPEISAVAVQRRTRPLLPSRSVVGLSSDPSGPTKTSSRSAPNSRRTWSARVSGGRPPRLALVEIKGLRRRLQSLRASGCAVTRTASVCRPPPSPRGYTRIGLRVSRLQGRARWPEFRPADRSSEVGSAGSTWAEAGCDQYEPFSPRPALHAQ